jgi:hypothetical protein
MAALQLGRNGGLWWMWQGTDCETAVKQGSGNLESAGNVEVPDEFWTDAV